MQWHWWAQKPEVRTRVYLQCDFLQMLSEINAIWQRGIFHAKNTDPHRIFNIQPSNIQLTSRISEGFQIVPYL